MKLFSIGVYSALLGQDRSIDEVCNLIRKPRTKKEAKIYYKIDSEDAQYQEENEDTVSEVEIQNIRAHYKKLGKNEAAYVESFNSIANQYTDSQLKVIIKFLPLNVKAVLETESPKYQSLMSFSGGSFKKAEKEAKKESALKIDFIENQLNKPRTTKPVIVPSAVNTKKVTKLKKHETDNDLNIEKTQSQKMDLQDLLDSELDIAPVKEETAVKEIQNVEPPKRGRGRPKKIIEEKEENIQMPKRGRGRPKKIVEETSNEQESNINLFDLDEKQADTLLPGFEETMEEKIDSLLPGFEAEGINEENKEESNILPGLDEIENDDNIISNQEYSSNSSNNLNSSEILKQNNNSSSININSLLTRDQKIVSFVGTTKNGTSFLINNLGELFSSMGINTAILDATKNKNSYYIYTKNEEQLRNIASNSINNLSNGKIGGIPVNKNLTVYTSLPTENGNYNYNEILSTLVRNYSLVLIDCDFDTDISCFENSQEIYLVQSMDILTIQPLTAFLRDLKAKNVLSQDKLRIVVNKEARVKSLNAKVVIGGMAYYNDPAMSFMTELFNKDNIRYCTIPFDEQVYSKYLSGLVNCKVSTNGYTKNFMTALKQLGNMVYPLLNNKFKPIDNF